MKKNWGGNPNLHYFILCLIFVYIRCEAKLFINNYNPHAKVKYVSYSGSISTEITFPTSPYKIL